MLNVYLDGKPIYQPTDDTLVILMISDKSELAELLKHYPPGTVAYTAGFKAMWQLSAAGTWVSMM